MDLDKKGKMGSPIGMVDGTIVPNSFLPAIGYVVVAFSRLDTEIDLLIAYLLGYWNEAENSRHRTVRCALAEAVFNYQPKITLIRNLIDEMTVQKRDHKKLGNLLDLVQALANERHRLIHDEFTSYSFVGEHAKMYRKGPAHQHSLTVSKAQLEAFGQQISKVTYRLQRFRKEDPAWKTIELFPWRGKPPQKSQKGNRHQKGGQSA